MPKILDKPIEKCGSYADYQNFVAANLRKYYPNPDALARSTWDIIQRLWNLDLSETDILMSDKYSKFGPAPSTPSCMQRSDLLSIDFKVSSLTEWAAQLKINPLYAVLGGCMTCSAGLSGNTVRSCKYAFGCFWNTTATHMLEAGIPIVAIKNFLGHASIATTMRYAELSQGTVDKHIREWNEKWFPQQNIVSRPTDAGIVMLDFLK